MPVSEWEQLKLPGTEAVGRIRCELFLTPNGNLHHVEVSAHEPDGALVSSWSRPRGHTQRPEAVVDDAVGEFREAFMHWCEPF